MQWWLLAILSITLIPTVSPCRCFPPNPQQHYCDSDFVLKVRVKEKMHFGPNPNGEIRYLVDTEIVYKDTDTYGAVVDKQYLWTTDNSASCGLSNLRKNKLYVVTGYISQAKLWVNTCQWNSKWSLVTKTQKQGLRKKYMKQCDKCKIVICSGCSPQPDSCLIRTDINPYYMCYYRLAICRKKKNMCSFTESKELTVCLQGR